MITHISGDNATKISYNLIRENLRTKALMLLTNCGWNSVLNTERQKLNIYGLIVEINYQMIHQATLKNPL